MVYTRQLLWTNNAQTTLAGSISNVSTTANLASGTGVLFPSPGSNQGFTGTFTDAATGLLREIVLVTGRTGDTITMVRAQEGTTALNWTANDVFGNLWTAGAAATLVQSYQLQLQNGNFAVDTGSVNAYVVAFTPAISSAPSAGVPFRVQIKTGNTNTGASTINLGWGNVNVVRRDGSALIGGELVGSHIVNLNWNGTAVEIDYVSPATAAAISAGTDTQSAVTPAQLANTSFAPTGSLTFTASINIPAGWLLCFGQAVSRVTYANLFTTITKSSTVTISIASPAVVTWAASGVVTGDVISFETTGSLPTGLSTATNYYVIRIDANTFSVATSMVNAGNNVAINTSGSQSGTQTCRKNPFGCGDGSTTFNIPDGRDVTLAGWTGMGGTSRGLLGNNSSAGGFYTAALGNQAGAKDHTPIVTEMAAHTHTYDGAQPASTQPTQGGGASPNTGINTGSTGGGSNFNITQPTLLVNVMIKT